MTARRASIGRLPWLPHGRNSGSFTRQSKVDGPLGAELGLRAQARSNTDHCISPNFARQAELETAAGFASLHLDCSWAGQARWRRADGRRGAGVSPACCRAGETPAPRFETTSQATF